MLTPDAKTRCQDQMLALDANTGREDDEATQHNKTKQNKTKKHLGTMGNQLLFQLLILEAETKCEHQKPTVGAQQTRRPDANTRCQHQMPRPDASTRRQHWTPRPRSNTTQHNTTKQNKTKQTNTLQIFTCCPQPWRCAPASPSRVPRARLPCWP